MTTEPGSRERERLLDELCLIVRNEQNHDGYRHPRWLFNYLIDHGYDIVRVPARPAFDVGSPFSKGDRVRLRQNPPANGSGPRGVHIVKTCTLRVLDPHSTAMSTDLEPWQVTFEDAQDINWFASRFELVPEPKFKPLDRVIDSRAVNGRVYVVEATRTNANGVNQFKDNFGGWYDDDDFSLTSDQSWPLVPISEQIAVAVAAEVVVEETDVDLRRAEQILSLAKTQGHIKNWTLLKWPEEKPADAVVVYNDGEVKIVSLQYILEMYTALWVHA